MEGRGKCGLSSVCVFWFDARKRMPAAGRAGREIHTTSLSLKEVFAHAREEKKVRETGPWPGKKKGKERRYNSIRRRRNRSVQVSFE